MEKTICELFAGVGGFRLGMERLNTNWKTVWFSQYEPSRKNQYAYDCYISHFGDLPDLNGEYHTNDDICLVNKKNIPNHTLLVGGFPCQDYSVAHWLNTSKGIQGKKGVLWWQIYDTLLQKAPPFCLFENVDRLIISPPRQNGRDFGVMLACLNELDYSVEWRVINAALYGGPSRRRRTFIFAYRNDTEYGKKQKNKDGEQILSKDGFMAKAFPIKSILNHKTVDLPEDIYFLSETFAYKFGKAGYMHDGTVFSADVEEEVENPIVLRDLVEHDVEEHFFLTEDIIEKVKFLKGYKQIPRKSKDGHEYLFTEGAIDFPDPLDKPARTMLTNEATLQRTTHVIADADNGRLRHLTPLETERIQGFDDNWTNTGMPLRARYFCMGNALVVPMITRMGKVLDLIIQDEP